MDTDVDTTVAHHKIVFLYSDGLIRFVATNSAYVQCPVSVDILQPFPLILSLLSKKN
jgi:hypothetical protein